MMLFLKRFACLVLLVGDFYFATSQNSPKGEIIYHVFQRSFYDSNGDLHGDLNGLRQKLEYNVWKGRFWEVRYD